MEPRSETTEEEMMTARGERLQTRGVKLRSGRSQDVSAELLERSRFCFCCSSAEARSCRPQRELETDRGCRSLLVLPSENTTSGLGDTELLLLSLQNIRTHFSQRSGTKHLILFRLNFGNT